MLCAGFVVSLAYLKYARQFDATLKHPWFLVPWFLVTFDVPYMPATLSFITTPLYARFVRNTCTIVVWLTDALHRRHVTFLCAPEVSQPVLSHACKSTQLLFHFSVLFLVSHASDLSRFFSHCVCTYTLHFFAYVLSTPSIYCTC